MNKGKGIRKSADAFLFKIPLNDLKVKRTRNSIYSNDATVSATVPTGSSTNDVEVELMSLGLDFEQNLENHSIPNSDNLAWDHDVNIDAVGMEVEDQGLCDLYSINGSVNTNEFQVRFCLCI